MPGDESGGSLSQDDIDGALADAGLDNGGGAEASETPAAESSSDATSPGLNQADIDTAPAGEGSSPAEEPAEPAEPGEQPAAPDTRVDSAGRPFDEVAAAMADAIESEAAGAAAPESQEPPASEPSLSEASPVELPQLETASADDGAAAQGIDLLRDVQLNVKIELGRSRMLVDDVLRLGQGSVVELDKLAGDPVDVYVNDRLVARGEVLVLNDNFCVRINDIVRQEMENETN
jgi:flagellar motor switch protein FliN/FliY